MSKPKFEPEIVFGNSKPSPLGGKIQSFIFFNCTHFCTYTGWLKKRPIVNCQVTAFMNGIRRDEEKIKYPPWQDASNGMWPDSQRYLVPEKIDNLGEILTLI